MAHMDRRIQRLKSNRLGLEDRWRKNTEMKSKLRMPKGTEKKTEREQILWHSSKTEQEKTQTDLWRTSATFVYWNPLRPNVVPPVQHTVLSWAIRKIIQNTYAWHSVDVRPRHPKCTIWTFRYRFYMEIQMQTHALEKPLASEKTAAQEKHRRNRQRQQHHKK